MNPSTSGNSTNLRKQIGPAVWLLILLVQHTPGDWTGNESAWVAGGNVVSDSELVNRLGISLSALNGWRRRLRRLGLMGWLLSPRHGRAYWVAGVARVFADSQTTEQSVGTEADKPTRAPAAAVWKAVQERLDERVARPLIDKVLKIGDKYQKAREADPAVAEGLHLLDNAPQYLRSKGGQEVHNIIGDLSRAQERLFTLMADADSRENLRVNHPQEYAQAQRDPAIQEALKKYKPLDKS